MICKASSSAAGHRDRVGGRSSGALAAAVALAAGCAAPRAGTPAAAPGPAPAYATLARAQDERLDRLTQLQASGSIELRWTDERGAHFENGDLDLLLALPRRSALRISKLTSEDLFWLGSDERRYWFFDLLSEPTTLLTAPHGTALSTFDARAPLSLQPLVLIDLLGLTRLSAAGDGAEPAVEWDSRRETWSVVAPEAPVRIGFAPGALVPAWVEALDPATGELIATSMLSEYSTVAVPDTPPLQWPRFPERIEVRDVAGTGSVRLFVRDRTGRVDERRLERVFDLATLVRALQPDRVEER